MTKYTLSWITADRQASLNMGEFETEEEAKANIQAALKELMDNCSNDEDREEFDCGTFEIEVEG